jgi:hypothetical protein
MSDNKTSGINLFNSFKSNKDLELNGVPVLFGKNSRDVMIKIFVRRAGGGNTAFTQRYEVLTKPYRRIIQMGKSNEISEEMADIMRRLYAETVVVGWEGVLGPDDETELPFTVDNCIDLFKASDEVFNEVVTVSTTAAVYRDEVRSADAKD